ncbi:uncharacterized protein V6R79_020067 [Siganus canaliculatus]
MRNFILTSVFLCSLSWISLSGLESHTVEAQPGHNATMLCPNFTSSASQIIWFMVNGSQVRCVGHMFTASEPAKFCEEFQKGKFEMKSNGSTLSLTIKHVDLSDSRLYFCGYYICTDPLLVSATFLQVQETFVGIMQMILSCLIVFLALVIICLIVKIKMLQKGHTGEENQRQTEDQGSDYLNYAAVSFRPRTRKNRPTSGQVEPDAIYSATR